MELLKHAAYEKRAPDPAALLAAIPFCRHMGLSAEVTNGELTLLMPFAPILIGNPVLPALHGGAIGAFLETASIAQVIWELGGTALPKPIDITIDYLRTGRAIDSRAKARIAKRGRRVVNVHAELWQEDATKPVASLRGHFLLTNA
jgi:uncharacterized protein (TIGR00369 family)